MFEIYEVFNSFLLILFRSYQLMFFCQAFIYIFLKLLEVTTNSEEKTQKIVQKIILLIPNFWMRKNFSHFKLTWIKKI